MLNRIAPKRAMYVAVAAVLMFSACLCGAAQTAEAAPANHNPALKNIVILATGGTIAGTGAPGKTIGYQPGVLDIESLVADVPGIGEVANITGEQVLNVPSDNITSEDLLMLAKRINELAQDGNVDGFVITHGTDTMEESAYFLHLTARTDKPIVFAGASRPSTAISADGPMNLYEAAALAASPEAAGNGVLVLFSSMIFSARDVTKTRTSGTENFGSRDLGCLGYMRDGEAFFYQQSMKPHTTQTPFGVSGLEHLPKVDIAYFHIDSDPDILEYMIDNNEGLVIACAGDGGYSKLWADKIAELAEKNVPIVRSSRIDNGIVDDDPEMAPTISANNLNPQKARILLALALTQTNDINKIEEYFKTY